VALRTDARNHGGIPVPRRSPPRLSWSQNRDRVCAVSAPASGDRGRVQDWIVARAPKPRPRGGNSVLARVSVAAIPPLPLALFDWEVLQRTDIRVRSVTPPYLRR
jgi:hypothetical protein